MADQEITVMINRAEEPKPNSYWLKLKLFGIEFYDEKSASRFNYGGYMLEKDALELAEKIASKLGVEISKTYE
ncbi:MAG: hypothetical protein UV75_C0007G0010 [Candidatus Giovannonibacteria bacterium GW2011_GWA1_43_15]|uniref:Uncharacterized protein n=3 Tax=Parcubacteria group TaxID=1794811 RepID=A0A0G1IUV4_9BACT|nr:MAG: hypothetical protein UU83_C0039G0002 [Candidatus Jorgensenbacteria bacterium GW2011_GWF2_41_8]KKS96389.1 MAG: hypothetical protein UV72_C0003G0010 [Candidatus Giovannonibacteria bacterium GW2011_GWB1_43_13]KKS99253.1 MAG: hypothetical protein UV75_C0007G0010 [Candidatus Giovannonibacteria bacterium GW2011_GWA1_43_15]KKT20979.1 MAG: hypothetical protein UW05_C0021G0004 [Candidatus Giovannonibacteria bacterium GW2011_GWC2_43_8]KKT63136.1 MAG: hypothetical protein UW55_C0006G0005 [Candidat